jgi:antitoxin ParD1/3/4
MARATSIILGEHFDTLIAQQMQSGRYSTASEVVRDALRLFEQQQVATQRLSDAVDEGFASGFTDEIDWSALEKRAENIKIR